jgi:O-succinylbenzoic acid--CoA ligase
MISINAFLLRTQQLNSTAIQVDSQQFNYSTLKEKVLAVTQHLKTFDIQEKDNVAIIGNNETEYIINVLALWQLKAVPVLINPRLVSDEIDVQTAASNCKIILVSNKITVDGISLSDIHRYPFNIYKMKSNADLPEQLVPDDTAVIIFTSGASGNPKGVELSFNNLLQSAKTGDQVLQYSDKDKWLASLPFYHIAGFSIITRSLLFGSSIIIPDDIQTNSLIEAMEKFKPTLCSLVPTQLSRIMEQDSEPNEELRNVLLGGGYISPRLVTDAINSGWKITKVYGTTETASFVTALANEEVYEKPGSVGKALKPNKIIIVSENKFALPWGEIGEIAVTSPSVMQGYYKNEVETEKKFDNGYYLTGDIGYLDAEDYLFIEARRTDLIVTGGENVNPNEVENRITEHTDIIEAAVFPLKDDDWGEIVAAALVMQNGSDLIQLDDLEQFLKKDLAGFKIPKKIFFEDSLPVNELGKIVRSKLVEKYSEE